MKRVCIGALAAAVIISSVAYGSGGVSLAAGPFVSPNAEGVLENAGSTNTGKSSSDKGSDLFKNADKSGDSGFAFFKKGLNSLFGNTGDESEIPDDDNEDDWDWDDEEEDDGEEIFDDEEDDDDDWDWDDDDEDDDWEEKYSDDSIKVLKNEDGTVQINIIGDNNNVVVNNNYDIKVKNKKNKKDKENNKNNNNSNNNNSNNISNNNSFSSSGVSCPCVASPVRCNSNNTVPAFDCINSMAVGQGGKVTINGCKTGATVTVCKVEDWMISGAKGFAKNLGGTLINVVDSSAVGVRYGVMEVNFNVYGVKDGDNIAVYRYRRDGSWEPLPVIEVRKDHVIVKMSDVGILAFVRMPAVKKK